MVAARPGESSMAPSATASSAGRSWSGTELLPACRVDVGGNFRARRCETPRSGNPEEGLQTMTCSPARGSCARDRLSGPPGCFWPTSPARYVPGRAADRSLRRSTRTGGVRLSPAPTKWRRRSSASVTASASEGAGGRWGGAARWDFVGLKLGRDSALGPGSRRGVSGGPPLALYASSEGARAARRRRHPAWPRRGPRRAGREPGMGRRPEEVRGRLRLGSARPRSPADDRHRSDRSRTV